MFIHTLQVYSWIILWLHTIVFKIQGFCGGRDKESDAYTTIYYLCNYRPFTIYVIQDSHQRVYIFHSFFHFDTANYENF